MEKEIKELRKLVEAQDRQIRELKQVITKLVRRVDQSEKRAMRQDHVLRGHTGTINGIVKILERFQN